jgi:hypothetical protein
VLVCLPNFGDEKGVADALKLAGLDVPVLVQAYPDDLAQLHVERRRDAFCGKVSVCNNLRQYGIPFSLTHRHTVHVSSPEFRDELTSSSASAAWSTACARRAHRRHRRRPNAFNTTRYSEKLLRPRASASARSISRRCSRARDGCATTTRA